MSRETAPTSKEQTAWLIRKSSLTGEYLVVKENAKKNKVQSNAAKVRVFSAATNTFVGVWNKEGGMNYRSGNASAADLSSNGNK